MTLRFPITMWCIAFSSFAMSEQLSVQDLVRAISSDHPTNRASISEAQVIYAEIEEADAAFDINISQQTQARAGGYYDGGYANQEISKPLSTSNASIFGSYRISDGEFPVYEEQYQTATQGEVALGVRLSLLQSRDIDSRRTERLNATWRHSEAVSRQELSLNQLIFAGVSTYLDLLQSLEVRNISRRLLELTESRVAGLRARVETGDVASISLAELETALLRRQLTLIEAERAITIQQERLRFFLPPSMFNRIPAKTISLDQIGWPYESNSRALNDVDVMISAHPRMATLDAALSRAQNRKRLAINETLPKLDLEMKVAKGLGKGDPWLSDEETVIGVAFAMPLGQRAAKARQRAEEAAITSLEYESIALERELRRDVDMGRAQLSYQRDIVALAKKMEAASEHLLSQETKRFREGSSDQFVLLSREKAFLEAQLTATAAKYELRRQELTLFASLAQLNFE